MTSLSESSGDPEDLPIVLKVATGTPLITAAGKVLARDIKENLANPDAGSYLLTVNFKTADVHLDPVLTLPNLEKLRLNYENLPEGVKKVIENNTRKEVLDATHTIWDELAKRRALENKKSEG